MVKPLRRPTLVKTSLNWLAREVGDGSNLDNMLSFYF